MLKQFGGKVTKELSARYEQSPNWKNGIFENQVETLMNISLKDIPGLLYEQLFDRKGRAPKIPIPIPSLDKEAFLASGQARFVWYGHSVVLMRMQGKTILIDPMFGPDAAPIAPFKAARFSENTLAILDELPPIDLVLLTHDHYDHLDLASFKRLMPNVPRYFVALGSARHLISWGVPESKITEFDWWDAQDFEGIRITFTPSRHFSGRGISDRAKSLWGGWTLKTDQENIYFSGDGGYGAHFKEVGERLGPFDFGLMECGQYNALWHAIHMYPEESVQAALDAGVRQAMAIHWGGFALAMHTWKDPIERFTQAAKDQNLPTNAPKIGAVFSYANPATDPWWEGME